MPSVLDRRRDETTGIPYSEGRAPVLLLQDLVQNLQCLRLSKWGRAIESGPIHNRGAVDMALRVKALRPMFQGVDIEVRNDVATTIASRARATTVWFKEVRRSAAADNRGVDTRCCRQSWGRCCRQSWLYDGRGAAWSSSLYPYNTRPHTHLWAPTPIT